MEKRFKNSGEAIAYIMETLPCSRSLARVIWSHARFDGFFWTDHVRGEFVLGDSDMLIDYAERLFGVNATEENN